MANKAATEPCVCIIRDDRLVQTCSAHDAAIKNAQSAEVARLKSEHNKMKDSVIALTRENQDLWRRHESPASGRQRSDDHDR